MSAPGPTLEGELASLRIDERVFPLPVVYGACLGLLDRAYLRLERPEDGVVLVKIKSKGGGAPRALSGELANEMLNQCIRHRLGDRMGKLREAYLAKAFSDREATLDALLRELDEEEMAGDELEVSRTEEPK